MIDTEFEKRAEEVMKQIQSYKDCPTLIPYAYDKLMESRKWMGEIPFIEFPKGWKVQVIPPFAGAVVRFRVMLPSKKEVSIYLDCYDRLGWFGKPYWEVYPFEGDTFRCEMEDTKALVKAISESEGLNKNKAKKKIEQARKTLKEIAEKIKKQGVKNE